jgi:biofilm PGA synthesis N-glycosyltransferase PgaC
VGSESDSSLEPDTPRLDTGARPTKRVRRSEWRQVAAKRMQSVEVGRRSRATPLSRESAPRLLCSVGIMAYNEEANIAGILEALCQQRTHTCAIAEIIVLASGCTDGTEAIVREFCRREPRIKLVTQPTREGKASAVNLFLSHARCDLLVLQSADTLPDRDTLEQLVAPFGDPAGGMTGAGPVPVNDGRTFMGFAAHLQWAMHHQIALRRPKMGELIAFRRIFRQILPDTPVDEANVEPLILGQGFKLRYVPEAVVLTRGPQTVRDFVKQRRRIYAGHLRIRNEHGYSVSTMNLIRLLKALVAAGFWDWRFYCWTPAVIGLEVYARMLGWFDYARGRAHRHTVWEVATSTKGSIK